MEIRTITIEGVALPIAPTPVVKLAKAAGKGRSFDHQTEEGMAAVIEAVFWGIRRAKGEITLEWLQENIDVTNVAQVIEVFNELNAPRAGVGTAAEGEAQAGSPNS